MKLPLIFLLLVLPFTGLSQSKNGFDLADAIIPAQQIFRGGPPRDGIPAIDSPKFLNANQDTFTQPKDRILGIIINNQARAYPIKILNWHEIVNDRIGDQFFVITYCPLCGSGVAFSSLINNKPLIFGVSGLLYNSDVLLYDRHTDSLWSQIMKKGVSGSFAGVKLKQLPLSHTTWEAWKRQYPSTQVLSTKTGFSRNYENNPYTGYEKSRQLYFNVSQKSPNLYHPKEQVLGVEIGNTFKAYPFFELNQSKLSIINDEIENQQITIHWDESHQSGKVLDKKGTEIPVIQLFWFAWYTFHPETLIYQPD
jgi:hypothetical protein